MRRNRSVDQTKVNSYLVSKHNGIFEEGMKGKNGVAYRGTSELIEAKDIGIESEGSERIEYDIESKTMKNRGYRDNKGEIKDKIGDKETKKDEPSNGRSDDIRCIAVQSDAYSVKPLEEVRVEGDGNLGKRKELEINGFILETGSRPLKLPSHVTTSPRNPQHGMNSKYGQTAKEKKGKRVFDVMAVKKDDFPTTMEDSSMRLPHSDSVLLGQILFLPEIDRTLDYDDQEWLFCSTHHQDSIKISNLGLPERKITQIFALRYVVPY